MKNLSTDTIDAIHTQLLNIHSLLHAEDESLSLGFCDALELSEPDMARSVELLITKLRNAP